MSNPIDTIKVASEFVSFNPSTAGGTASNLGSGGEVFKAKVGSNFEFRSLAAGTNVTINQNANDLTINSTAQAGLQEPTRDKEVFFTGVGAEPARTPLASVTVVTGTACLLFACASGLATPAAGSPRLYILVDGVEKPYLGCIGNSYGANEGVHVSWMCVAEGLTPGSHTFELNGSYGGPGQWTVDGIGDNHRQTAWIVAIPLS